MSSRSPRRRRSAKLAAGPPAAVLLPRAQVPCGLCGLCCTYVTADIEPPNSVPRASRIVWYLYHEGVSVYWDRDATWMVQFETRCRFFGEDRRCEIYAQRPHVCRDFDERECEVNAADAGVQFHEPSRFLEWLAERRPRLHARLLAEALVPSGSVLGRPPVKRRPLAPYLDRYRALRAAGAERIGPG
jgi:Fe-S-cluster containining protein